jgi:hypothetical protein
MSPTLHSLHTAATSYLILGLYYGCLTYDVSIHVKSESHICINSTSQYIHILQWNSNIALELKLMYVEPYMAITKSWWNNTRHVQIVLSVRQSAVCINTLVLLLFTLHFLAINNSTLFKVLAIASTVLVFYGTLLCLHQIITICNILQHTIQNYDREWITSEWDKLTFIHSINWHLQNVTIPCCTQ